MIAAILLAAGESTRMGRPKALLPWRDTTLVEYQVRELTAAGVERIAVVLGHDPGEVWPHMPDEAHLVATGPYREGRGSQRRPGDPPADARPANARTGCRPPASSDPSSPYIPARPACIFCWSRICREQS